MPLLPFWSRGEMWALSGRRWASCWRHGAMGTVTILQSSREAKQKKGSCFDGPCQTFLKSNRIRRKMRLLRAWPSINTPLELTKQKHNHLHFTIKKKTWRTVALLDLVNWIIKLRWKFCCKEVTKALWPGQNNSEQSIGSTQDLSSLEKWGLVSTSYMVWICTTFLIAFESNSVSRTKEAWTQFGDGH